MGRYESSSPTTKELHGLAVKSSCEKRPSSCHGHSQNPVVLKLRLFLTVDGAKSFIVLVPAGVSSDVGSRRFESRLAERVLVTDGPGTNTIKLLTVTVTISVPVTGAGLQ